MENDYYVYMYLDPRKPLTYMLNDTLINFEPYYVGKGKNERYKHLLTNKTNTLKANITKKIIESGLYPQIIKISENLTSDDAYLLESSLIQQIGTRIKIENVPPGPLSNAMLTGVGIATHTEETLKILSEKATQQWTNKELREWKSRQMSKIFKDTTLRIKLSKKLKDVCSSVVWKEQKSQTMKDLWNTETYRQSQTKSINEGCSTEEYKQQKSEKQKENWRNEEYRKSREGQTRSEEVKKKMSEAAKRRNQDEREIENKRRRQKLIMEDPNIRKRISEKLKGRKQSEETKEKRRQSLLKSWEKRRLQEETT